MTTENKKKEDVERTHANEIALDKISDCSAIEQVGTRRLSPDERKELSDLDLERRTNSTKKLQREHFAELKPAKREKIINAIGIIEDMYVLDSIKASRTERQNELEVKQGFLSIGNFEPIGFAGNITMYETFKEGIGKLTKQELIEIHAQQVIEEALSGED